MGFHRGKPWGIFALLCALTTGLVGGCRSGSGNGETTDDDGSSIPDEPLPGVAEGCGSVRMTQYTSSDRRWCGFDRTSPILPDFVQQGMTVAIAEPYNGSSYEGEPGEACGECWELSTTFASTLVMVHDLCPIEGNPICAGSWFHFDVATEVADVVGGGGWLGEAAVRRVPCPVTGNIYVYITARNRWGYLQLAFFNHRVPIRTVEYRAADGDEWLPMERCLARWCLDGDMETFADDGPGGIFRFISADGETVEAAQVLTYAVSEGSNFDLGVQFSKRDPIIDTCEFIPPGDVYDDEWGGIDGVRWEPNTWGDTVLSEIDKNCADGSASCLLLDNFEAGGLHITYRHIFPISNFTTLSLKARTASGSGTVEAVPRTEDERCSVGTTFSVDENWTTIDIDVAEACPEVEMIHGLTVSRSDSAMDLVIDDIQFIE